MLRKNVAGQFVHIAGINVTTGAIVTGATWTMRRCLDGTFAAGGATITEDGTTGFYKVALAQADTDGNDIGYFFTATNAVPVTINVVTTAADPTNATTFGLTNLDAAITSRMATYTQPTGFLAATFPSGTVANTTNITAGTITTVGTLTTYTGNTVQTGDAFARIGAAGVSLSAIPDEAGVTTLLSRLSSARAGYLDNVNNSTLAAASFPTDPADESLIIAATDAIMTRIGAAGAGLTALGDTRIANLDATISSRTKPADTQARVTLVDTLTTYTSNTLQTGDSFARLGAPAGASISADIATKATPAQILTTALVEAYAADNVAPTLSQLLFLLLSVLTDFTINSTTLTAHKLDGTTTSATFTLNDAVAPTGITRAT